MLATCLSGVEEAAGILDSSESAASGVASSIFIFSDLAVAVIEFLSFFLFLLFLLGAFFSYGDENE